MEPRDESPRPGNQRLNQALRRVRYAQQEFPVQQFLAQSRRLRPELVRSTRDHHVRTPTPMPPPIPAQSQPLAQAPALPTLDQEEIQAYYLRSLTEKAESKSPIDDDLLIFDESGSEDGDNASRGCSGSLTARTHEGPRVSNSRFSRLMETGPANSPRTVFPLASTSVNTLDSHASRHFISIGLGNKALASYMENRPNVRRSSSMDLRDTAMTPKVDYEDFCATPSKLSPRSKTSDVTDDDMEVLSLGRTSSPRSVTDEDLGTSDASLGRSARPKSRNTSEEDLGTSDASLGKSVHPKSQITTEEDLGTSMASLGFSTRSKIRSVTDEDLDLEVISLGKITTVSKPSDKNLAADLSDEAQLITSRTCAALEIATSSSLDNRTLLNTGVAKETESSLPIRQPSSAWSSNAPSVFGRLKKRISRVFARITRPIRACLHPATKE